MRDVPHLPEGRFDAVFVLAVLHHFLATERVTLMERRRLLSILRARTSRPC